MIQIAIISPILCLQYSNYGDLDMVLTPFLVEKNKSTKYERFYRNSKRYKILDNGAFELGAGCEFQDVIKAAKRIHADEVILRDFVYKNSETVDAARECIDLLKKNQLHKQFIIHAVPQGSNKREWMDCLAKLMSMKEVSVIGLSKLSVPKCFGNPRDRKGPVTKSRIRAILEIIRDEDYSVKNGLLYKKDSKSTGKKIHLLGGDNWSAYEVSVLKKYSFIRSIDTSMPVWYGLQNTKIDALTGKCSVLHEKVDLLIKPKITPQIASSISHNISVLQSFSKQICPREDSYDKQKDVGNSSV